jgi:hypothetical protein
VRLDAAEVYFHPNDDNRCATVGFRAVDDTYFLISRALMPTEQDRSLGHDAVHLELSDQGLSCYDGIGAVSVFPTTIRIDFNERGEQSTQRRFIEIHHDLPPDRSWQLRQMLGLVFDGFARYADLG